MRRWSGAGSSPVWPSSPLSSSSGTMPFLSNNFWSSFPGRTPLQDCLPWHREIIQLEEIAGPFLCLPPYVTHTRFRNEFCLIPETVFLNFSGNQESIPTAYVAWGPVRQIELYYRPARLHRLAESISGLLKRLQIRAPFQTTRIKGTGEGICWEWSLDFLL